MERPLLGCMSSSVRLRSSSDWQWQGFHRVYTTRHRKKGKEEKNVCMKFSWVFQKNT